MKRCLFLAVIPFVMLAMTQTVQSKPTKLKAVRFTKKTSASFHYAGVLFERINDQAKGELEIEVLGGPEVIRGRDQADGVRKGVVDLSCVPSSYYGDLVPQVSGMLMSEKTPSEERAQGYYDFLNEYHKKVGMYFLGRTSSNLGFYIFTKKKIDRPQHIAGLQLRASPGVASEFVKALRATPVHMGHSDTYSALERGVVDGAVGPLANIAAYKQYEVLDFWIDHPFYHATAAVLIVNLDTWNSLPNHLQGLILDEQKKIENEMRDWCRQVDKKNIKIMVDAGMKPIVFSPEDAKKYLELANQSIAGRIRKDVNEEEAKKIIQFLTQ